MIHQPRVISTGNEPAETAGKRSGQMPVARQPVFTPMPPIRKRARHTSLATHRLGDAPLGRRTAWATHRLTSLYGPDPNRQGAFSQPDAGKAGRPSRILRARNRRHVADMSPGPIAARPRAATAFRSFLQAAPAATTVCRRKGRRGRPAAAVPDRRRQLQPISVAG